jgi:hypothetical protein
VSPVQSTLVATTTPDMGAALVQNDGRYTNPNYGFSFMPPAGFTVAAFPNIDQGGIEVTTVLVQDAAKQKGVQIVISPWDEPADALTTARIRHDIPSMRVSSISTREIGNIGTMISFASDNPDFGGKSLEVWFVAHDSLYQLSTYADSSAVLDGILSTWSFQ